MMLYRFTAAFISTSCIAFSAQAQVCNPPSGFLKSIGEYTIGSQVVFGPDCEQVQDASGGSLPGTGVTFQQSGAGSVLRNMQDKAREIVSAADFGAVCDGVTDDSAAIQNAINSLPARGGIVKLAACNYRINTRLAIGDGTAASASTRSGIFLEGVANVGNPVFPGYTSPTGTKITWGGGTGVQGIIQVNGPIQGYGLHNLYVDCAGISGVFGINVTSASFGDNRNIVVTGCERGIVSGTVALFGSFTNTDSIHTSWYNTTVNIPNVANAMGILLSGTVAANSNTDYNNFYNTWITINAGAAVVTGLYLQSTDTVHFYNTHMSSAGNVNAICVVMDYTLANSFPSATRFMGIDVANCGGGTQWAVNGTPGAGARVNYVYVDEANNSVAPVIANTMAVGGTAYIPNPGGNNIGQDFLGAWQAFTPSLTCGTATFTTNSARRMFVGKTVHIEIDFTINTIGTCTSPVTFTLPRTAQSSAFAAGFEVAINNHMGGCTMASASATATCRQNTGIAFVVNERWVVSGTYESQ